MLKKRLIGVITVRQGWAVQSIGYNKYLPLGRPEVLAENLDRWGVDEILIQCIDRTTNNSGPNLVLLDSIAKAGLGTPLVYSGGISTPDEALAVIQRGADRIAVDAALRDSPEAVDAMASQLGAQALIGVVPCVVHDGLPQIWCYRSRSIKSFGPTTQGVFKSGAVSEILIVDAANEGRPQGFQQELLTIPELQGMPIIAFGGISTHEQMIELYQKSNVVAVAVGNFLNYREHAVQRYKAELKTTPVRPVHYYNEHGSQK